MVAFDPCICSREKLQKSAKISLSLFCNFFYGQIQSTCIRKLRAKDDPPLPYVSLEENETAHSVTKPYVDFTCANYLAPRVVRSHLTLVYGRHKNPAYSTTVCASLHRGNLEKLHQVACRQRCAGKNTSGHLWYIGIPKNDAAVSVDIAPSFMAVRGGSRGNHIFAVLFLLYCVAISAAKKAEYPKSAER